MEPHYTDPLKAAWMAREFDIRYQTETGLNCWIRVGGDLFDALEDGETVKAYIHPDSLHIFEPQNGDRICNKKSGSIYTWGAYHYGILSDDEEIIRRNGRAFFMLERGE